MSAKLLEGNEAVVYGALLAGCQAFFGYPITPASEIAHLAAKLFPKLNRVFIQAESELAAINMVYGASSAGVRAMTASSSPGISLKLEGISYLAGAELPAVIVDVMRSGPGLGNIGPEQSDYHQLTKGGGHGSYRCIVLAPNSAQEMCDMTMLAFELADQYRTPAFVATDGLIGQMMEVVRFPEPIVHTPVKEWAANSEPETNNNVITSIYLDFDDMEAHILHLDRKYQQIISQEVRYETYRTEDAEILLIGYGIMSRIGRTVVDQARLKGLRVGLLRPKTLWPFPAQQIQELAEQVKHILVIELSTGQLVDDVRLAVLNRCPVQLYYRVGGNIPSYGEVLEQVESLE